MLWNPPALAEEFVRVKINGGWAGLGMRANWGDGVLTYEGRGYPFSLTALSIGDLGAAGSRLPARLTISTDTATTYEEPTGDGTGVVFHDLRPDSLGDTIGWAVST